MAINSLVNAIRNDYEARRLRNPAYSLRAYARFLGIPPSGLSDILNGKREVTSKMAAKFLARIPMTPDAAQAFLSNTKQRKQQPGREYVLIEKSLFELISHWPYLATITLAETDDFRGTSLWLSSRLGISKAMAAEVLKKLAALGYLVVERGTERFYPTHKNFTTSMDIPSVAIQRSHQEHLELASNALRDHPVEERDFSFVNMATDPALISEAKKRITKFRRDLCAFLESSPKKTSVLRLGIQIFSLTKNNKGKTR